MKRCKIAYDENFEGSEVYHLMFTNNKGEWVIQSTFFFIEKELINYQLLTELSRLVNLGYEFIGVV